MKVKNFETAELSDLDHCHEGIGTLRHAELFRRNDLQSQLQFMNLTIIPPGCSIGYHKHGEDEEIYIILEGKGIMTFDGHERKIVKGDILVNDFHGSHSLENNSNEDIKILVLSIE